MKKVHQALKVEYICENVNDKTKVFLCSKCSFTSTEKGDIKEHTQTNHLKKKEKRKVPTKVENDSTVIDTGADHKIENEFDYLKEDSENIDPLTELDEKLLLYRNFLYHSCFWDLGGQRIRTTRSKQRAVDL